MATAQLGSFIEIIRDEITEDPTGASNSRTIEYKGTSDAIITQFLASRDCTKTFRRSADQGPYDTLICTWKGTTAGGPETEEPEQQLTYTDTYSIASYFVEKDIFEHPIVYAEMMNATVPSDYRRYLETMVKQGSSSLDPTFPFYSFPYAPQVLRELNRGATHYQTSTLVFSRVRIIDLGYPVPMHLVDPVWIYSTPQLPQPADWKWTSNVESAYIGTLPQTIWGWKITTQEVEYVDKKIQQRVSFTLANWSSLLYKQATGPYES